jgi:histidinol-phosphate aminotransferase
VSGQAAAVAALADQAFVQASRAHNLAVRGAFMAALEALGNHGIRPLPSEANFVLALFEGALTAETALRGLAELGFAVRHLPGQGLPEALRITIGTAGQMDAVAEGLRVMAERAA